LFVFLSAPASMRVPVFKKKKKGKGAGEMAQWLRAQTDLPEDTGSIPSTHLQLTTACNTRPSKVDALFGPQ
jgi:hypothetical protein